MDIMSSTHYYVYDGDNNKEGLDPIVERAYHTQLICQQRNKRNLTNTNNHSPWRTQ